MVDKKKRPHQALSAPEQVWDVIGMPRHLARKDIGQPKIG